MAAGVALNEAPHNPPALVLLLSPTLRQFQELFRKVMSFYHGPDRPMDPEQESALRMELPNGSRVVSLPGKEETVRSYSGVRLLMVDEAARFTDDLYYVVRPMLATSKGRMVCLSTPFGKREFFYDEWKSDREWKRVNVLATECPRISPECLDEEKTVLGEWLWRQEYGVEFVDTRDQAFPTDYIMEAFVTDARPLFEDTTKPEDVSSIVTTGVAPLFPK